MGPALNDAVGGQAQVIFDNLPSLAGTAANPAGFVRWRSPAKRVAALLDIPTFGEAGVEDANRMAFFGLIAPKDMPAPIVQRLNSELFRG